MIRSLFSKMFISHLLIILLITLSTGMLVSHLITAYLIESKRTELISKGYVAAKLLQEQPQNVTNVVHSLANMSELSGVKMWLINHQREIIGDTPEPWRRRFQNDPETNIPNQQPHHRQSMQDRHEKRHQQINNLLPMNPPPSPAGEATSWIRKANNDDDPSITVAIPLHDETNSILFLYTPIFGITKTANALQDLLFYAMLISTALAAFLAFFLSRNLTRPIRNITTAAQNFATGDYSCRTTATKQDEIGRLGQTFNQLAETLEQIEKNRREFFSNVTHELKTPIASIQALTESIMDGMVTSEEKRNRYLSTIITETHHMNHLISELLHLEKLESGQFSFQYQTIDLLQFLNDLQEKYTPLLQTKQLTLQITPAENLTKVKIDPNRLEQILANLISNAIRHSPEGSTIELKLKATTNNQFTLQVIDHGEGISPEHLPLIWDRFYRIDKARSRAEGGTGLGLSITKKLVEGMHGTITVKSTPKQETIFTIQLPR